MSRARSVEIYLKPGIEEDDQVHEVWTALRGRARPQDVFRRALRLGIRAMAEAGELPRSAIEALDPDFLTAPGSARALLTRGRRPRPTRDDLPARPAREASPTQPVPPAAKAPEAERVPDVTAAVRSPAAVEPGKRKLGKIM